MATANTKFLTIFDDIAIPPKIIKVANKGAWIQVVSATVNDDVVLSNPSTPAVTNKRLVGTNQYF